MERAHRTGYAGDKRDDLVALALTLGLHLVMAGIMLLAVMSCTTWERAYEVLHLPASWNPLACARQVAMPGPVIEATLIGPTEAPKSGARRPTPPKAVQTPPKAEEVPKIEPQPEPPKPQPEAKQEQKPQPQKETPPPPQKQDVIDQEKIAAIAQQKAEEQKKEQEAKQKQRQIELEQEQKEKQANEEKARKLEEQKKQLAEIKKQREAAEKKLNLEKQKLAQLEDLGQRQAAKDESQPVAEREGPRAQTGAGGQDDDLAARYAAAIQAAVTQSWNRPDSAAPGLRCSLNIVQIPGGDVISVSVGSPCNADQPTRNSIEQAVMKAAPLPYQGYEKVFQRSVKFNFRYDG